MDAMVETCLSGSIPTRFPLFPLSGAILLPGGNLPLNIFEPRYLEMTRDAMRTDRVIGMVQPCGGGDRPEVYPIGCVGRIASFAETEDGRYLIVLSGISRFRVRDEVEGFTPYRRIKVDWSDFGPDLERPCALPDFDKDAFLDLLRQYFEVAKLSSDWDSMREADPEMLINSLAMMCPFAVEEKQALLEAPCLSDRAETLTALLRFAIASGGGESQVQ